ncbi:ABC transporter [Sulfuricella sp. T08]|uniref:MlaA family lipoprotein n=1 Tax=Sulfuricella sp. T08 TaxID=1632857 RepID=UPI0006179914|nr:VacJ family lipoprotein [Sulfuricella sp. T08]GAO37463.1 ABC transporter [Sulfuricella sp. T08]
MRANFLKLPTVMLLSLALLGCATNGDPRDPLEPLNRGIYKFNDVVDKAVLKPVATGYKETMPEPVRTAVGNFFSNLDDVLVLLNDLLQFKLERAATDFSRLIWNTTVGIAGLIDVATPMDLAKHNEDFGQTLGYWGVGNGPYLVLPLLGPSTLRDAVGTAVDAHFDPVVQHSPIPERNSAIAIHSVDTRARLLDTEEILDEAALDRYVFLRDAYLQRRRGLVYDGNPPREKFEDYDDPAPAAPTSTHP